MNAIATVTETTEAWFTYETEAAARRAARAMGRKVDPTQMKQVGGWTVWGIRP